MHNLTDWVTHLNWVDFVFLVVLVYSMLTGAWLGFLAECLSVAGLKLRRAELRDRERRFGRLLAHATPFVAPESVVRAASSWTRSS